MPTSTATSRTGRHTTAPLANEIWKQTEGQVTHFVAGLGTSGTFMGTTRRLKELNPKIQCICMQPDSPFNGFEGLEAHGDRDCAADLRCRAGRREYLMETERAYAMAESLGARKGCWWAFRRRVR